MNNIIYHYTTVDVLALILQNKTIRFNSLKKVDDKLDGTHNNLKNAQDYIFASCWSKNKSESIPLWNMYSDNMSGIRIGVNKNLIKPSYKRVCKGSSYINLKEVINIVGNTNNIYCFTDDFETNVDYDDVKYNKFIEEIEEIDEKTLELQEIIYTKLAEIKQKCWFFQEETRFVLFAISREGECLIDGQTRLESILNNKRKPNVEHIDMILDSEVFTNMEILIGPKASPGSKVIIESLIEKFVPDFCGKIENSSLLIR